MYTLVHVHTYICDLKNILQKKTGKYTGFYILFFFSIQLHCIEKSFIHTKKKKVNTISIIIIYIQKKKKKKNSFLEVYHTL